VTNPRLSQYVQTRLSLDPPIGWDVARRRC
jgi:hypothetical protein